MNKMLLTIRSKKDYYNVDRLLIKYIKTQNKNIIEKIITIIIATTARYKAYGLKGINYLGNMLTKIINALNEQFKPLTTKLHIQLMNFIINY